MSKLNEPGLQLHSDVLVIGGGPAAAWAAIAAAERGARVIIADKGYLGTSGAFAASTSGAKVIPPLKELRDRVKFERYALGGHLSVHAWWDRILDVTFEKAPKIYEWGGYEAPVLDGTPFRGLQGPETMRIMRRQLKKVGVQILDQSPALELLVDEEGAVAGARGFQRHARRSWTVTAGAVVIASGGCAWLSKALGCNTNTGEGLLMAVEAGAELSGMEFSAHYAPAPKHASVTKNAYYRYASFADKDGNILEGLTKNGHRSTSAIAKELMKGPVFVRFDRGTSDPEYQKMLRMVQPNFMAAFDRANINPFTDWFEITLVLEGTVRGVGGIRIADDDCGTTVRGLYAAGDAATRELNCGGFTGGAGPNMTWAIGSGNIAGAGAAVHALALGSKALNRVYHATGKAGLVPAEGNTTPIDAAAIVKGTQDEFLPFERNIFRTEETLLESLAKLNQLWKEAQGIPAQENPHQLIRSREAVAILAAARWAYFAGLERKETRGMHKRLDYPKLDPAQRHYLAVGGLDTLWTRPVPVAEEVVPEPARPEAGVHV
ncbi:Succinate dehydrogenase/fumarate reductase, flavoprotein subunit [Verrucomicrobium sp. GAS474]|uniref:FAD-dependent oxidoreductase n=1 Tax=Verrucomicrobium sp. GAS474 TaxID=1882831 RepID=UPI00087BE889|nr:FAD-binding protein [Verrucomicrobium sp. GAS474]SDT85820.1 Succinate dehydrogenase/fumarate reductase, flavoprotein subunit [Verrucomicrobium sp. GAS474]